MYILYACVLGVGWGVVYVTSGHVEVVQISTAPDPISVFLNAIGTVFTASTLIEPLTNGSVDFSEFWADPLLTSVCSSCLACMFLDHMLCLTHETQDRLTGGA